MLSKNLKTRYFIFVHYYHSSLFCLQSDALSKMELWDEVIQKKIQTWIKKKNCLTVTVIGRTGTGKTSLINTLLGKKVGKEGYTLDRGIKHVESIRTVIQGVQVTIWYASGIQDGGCNDEEYLQEMIDSGCVDANLKVYCISMANCRLEGSEKMALSKFTTKCGVKFWEHCMFVLTFANTYVGNFPPELDRKERFDRTIELWRNLIKSELLKVGVDKRVVEQIAIVPAGYHKPLQIAPNPWKLPGIENWLYSFWYSCANVIDPTALPVLVKLNVHQFMYDEIKNGLDNTQLAVKLEQLFSLAHATRQPGQEESDTLDTTNGTCVQ